MEKTLDSEKIVYNIVKKVLKNRPELMVNESLVNDITVHILKKFPLKEIIFDNQTIINTFPPKVINNKIDQVKLSMIVKIVALVDRSIDSIIKHKSF